MILMNFEPLRFARFVAIALAVAAPSSTLAQEQPGDPPARVGRLAQISGTVSFHTSDQDQWGRASLNYPITSGNSFWTEPQANAALEVGANRLYLGGSTEFDLATLNEKSLVASMPRGAAYLRLATASTDDQYTIDTSRGVVNISEPGGYEILAGDADNPTIVTVVKGAAEFVANNVHLTIGPQQSAAIWGADQIYMSTGPAQEDDFVRYVKAQERPYAAAIAAAQITPPADQQRAPRPALGAPRYSSQAVSGNQPQPNEAGGYASPAMTGYQDLDRYGRWRETPNYGRIWFPEVRSNWAPYRDGHWAYVQPWGWTWIDDAPWGFTPFHYGRWIQVGQQWAWTPGQSIQRPVYAPAVVSFVGSVNIGGVAVSVATGVASGGGVGWVPLGPEEVYVPPYRTSPAYIQNVNVNNVRDVTKINNTTTNVTTVNQTVVNNYVNQSATTIVPTATMTGSRPVAPAAQPLDPAQLAKVISAGPVAPVKPTLATAGMTPTLARKIGAEAPPAATPMPVATVAGPALAPVVTETGQGGKPNKKPPAAVVLDETPPATGEPDKAIAPGPQIPPKNGAAQVATETGQGGKPNKKPPAAVVLNETPPTTGEADKAVAPGPQIPPKNGAAPVATETGQGGKPNKKPPAAVVLNDTPPATGEPGTAVAPGPQIPPKNGAGPTATETDQSAKPNKPSADSEQLATGAGAATGSCRIKGNISQAGDRVYLMPGERRYGQATIDKAKGELWFCTEAEAQAAGWHRAKS